MTTFVVDNPSTIALVVSSLIDRSISSFRSTTSELRIYIERQPLFIPGAIVIVGGYVANWKSSSTKIRTLHDYILKVYIYLPVAELGIR